MQNQKDVEALNKRISQAIKEEGLSTRLGMKFVGRVVSTKRRKTVTILIDRTNYLQKYSRYAKVRSKIQVHVPEGIEIKEGDIIEAAPTRKISKTKSAVVVRVLKRVNQ